MPESPSFEQRMFSHATQAMLRIHAMATGKANSRNARQISYFLTANTEGNNALISFLAFLFPMCKNYNPEVLLADKNLLKGNPCTLCRLLECACNGQYPTVELVDSYYASLDFYHGST